MVGDLRMILEFAVLATPGLGAVIVWLWTRLASAEAQVARMLRVVTVDPTKMPREAYEAAIAQAEIRRQFSGTARHMVEAARSVVLMSQGRSYVKRLRELAVPVLLIHGGRDRIVSARSAHAAASRRPEWTFQLIEEVVPFSDGLVGLFLHVTANDVDALDLTLGAVDGVLLLFLCLPRLIDAAMEGGILRKKRHDRLSLLMMTCTMRT
jgi:hypothetical protein